MERAWYIVLLRNLRACLHRWDRQHRDLINADRRERESC